MDSVTSGFKAAVSTKYHFQDNFANVFTSRFSSDGRFIAAGYSDGMLYIHNSDKGQILSKINVKDGALAHKSIPLALKISPTGLATSAHSVTGISWKPKPLNRDIHV